MTTTRQHNETTIETPNGPYDYAAPPEEREFYDLADIVLNLSQTNRFRGQNAAIQFSVAQHSLLVRNILRTGMLGPTNPPQAVIYQGLGHDLHEAFTGDMPRPLKILLGETWKRYERGCERAIRIAFGIEPVTLPIVKQADTLSLLVEAVYRFGDAVVRDTWGMFAPGEPAHEAWDYLDRVRPHYEWVAEHDAVAVCSRLHHSINNKGAQP